MVTVAVAAAETGELGVGGCEGLFDGALAGEGVRLADVIAVVVEMWEEEVEEDEARCEGQ